LTAGIRSKPVSRRKRNQPIKITVRLYPDQHDELVSWYETLADLPYGAKAQILRETLQRGLGRTEAVSAGAAPLDLAAVRQVVEAAVASALARFAGQMPVNQTESVPENDEIEDGLQALGKSLFFQEDEE
jgi:hypothetical protein